jgi:hypothetical protein
MMKAGTEPSVTEPKNPSKRRRSSQGEATPNPNKRQKKPFNREEWEAKRASQQTTASNLSGRGPTHFNELFVRFYKVWQPCNVILM